MLAQRGADLSYGRKLPRLLREAGLAEVAADAFFPITSPACTELEAATVRQIRAGLMAGGYATADEIDQHLANVATGQLDLATAPMISAWGRRPAAGQDGGADYDHARGRAPGARAPGARARKPRPEAAPGASARKPRPEPAPGSRARARARKSRPEPAPCRARSPRPGAAPGAAPGASARKLTPRSAITHRVNVCRYARQKQAALAAHLSLIHSWGRSGRLARVMLALPVPVFGLILGREWFAEPGAAAATVSGDILRTVPRRSPLERRQALVANDA